MLTPWLYEIELAKINALEVIGIKDLIEKDRDITYNTNSEVLKAIAKKLDINAIAIFYHNKVKAN
ncbi:MAG: hypothetical protein HC930_15840 [Hydrococcus sp. SU_1_0]|nr:hypothetical protein [Hydrococcus sp. SU_1_0]